ncbi:flippase [Phormidium sp. LEGE 05292]|uniref:flippase n=1 Tax=[Phormidium] sp. LEGE 05292 TaxID=767427 RepID=UPI00188233E3|nr:flippase [Phormidium sp. LEGE 05292]MBE9224335.1 flippase [Phormidium sp. LEGE 05292]
MLNKLTSVTQNISPELRKIIGNIGWLFGDRILRMGAGLIVGAWVARYLQPQQFGLFNYAGAYVALFTIISSLGLDQIVVRDIVRDPDCKDETMGTALALRIFGGIATVAITTVTVFAFNRDSYLTTVLAAVMAVATIFNAFNTIELWFQAQVKSKYTVIAKNTAFFLATLLRVVLIQIQAPLMAFAWAVVAESLLGAIGLTIAYKAKGQTFLEWRVSWQRAKVLLKESWSLILSGFAIMVYVRIDQIMLGQLLNEKAVGLYSVAAKISELWYFIASAIVSSVTPSIVKAREESQTLYYKKLQKLFNMMAVITFGLAIVMVGLSKPLIVLLYGQEYEPASTMLSIYIWSAVFGFFGWAKSIWIIAEGYTTFALITTCCGAAMNIGLNFWLIPAYGGNGAAIATVISYAFTDYVLCFVYPPARQLGWIMTRALTFNYFNFKNLW